MGSVCCCLSILIYPVYSLLSPSLWHIILRGISKVAILHSFTSTKPIKSSLLISFLASNGSSFKIHLLCNRCWLSSDGRKKRLPQWWEVVDIYIITVYLLLNAPGIYHLQVLWPYRSYEQHSLIKSGNKSFWYSLQERRRGLFIREWDIYWKKYIF